MAQAGQPAAVRVRAAGPLVCDLHHQPPRVTVHDDASRRPARVLGDVCQRLGDDKVRGRLDDGRRAPVVAMRS
jgi:hypothetical protein